MNFKKTVKVSSEAHFQEMRDSIKRNLDESKNEFQKIDENDIEVLQERLDTFCKNLRGVWERLRQYTMEHERQKIIRELQGYVNKGLKFQAIRINCEEFHLKHNDNETAEVVPSTGDNTEEVPF